MNHTLGLYTVCMHTQYPVCEVALWVWKAGSLFLLIMGTCGNVFNIAILVRKKLRKYSTTMYLLFLAVADLIALWTSTLEKLMLYVWETDINNISIFQCKTHEWMFQTMASFSVWLLALLTLERVIYTSCPVFAKRRMTRKLAIWTSVSVLSLIGLFQTHYIFGYNIRTVYIQISKFDVLQERSCVEISTYYRRLLEKYLGPIGITLFIAVPFVIIIIGNLTIVVSIWRQSRKVRPNLAGHIPIRFPGHVRNIKATKLLFTLCGFFTLSVIPYGIFALVYLADNNVWTERDLANAHLVFAILSILVMGNFTCNFLLYSVSGSLFKQEVLTVAAAMKGAVSRHWPWIRSDDQLTTQTNSNPAVQRI